MNAARADARALACLAIIVALLCATGLYRVVAVLPLHVPLDPNEGWNAYHAAAAMGAGPLYPGSSSFFFNNYPPLSFYIVGAFGRLIGDNIVAGRFISLLAFAFSCLAIFGLAMRMRCARLPSASAVLFFASVLLLFSDYVGMDDPQLMGHALQLGGLLIVFGTARTPRSMVAAGLLFAAGVFVKHNLFVLPLAVVLWLSLEDRRNALVLASAGAVVGVVSLILFRLAYGTDLLAHLITARVWSGALLKTNIVSALAWLLLPLAGVGVLFGVARDRWVELLVIYVALALVAALFFLGGVGVDVNVLFDAAIALSLSVAVGLDRLGARGPLTAAAATLVFLPLLFVLRSSIDSDWLTWNYWKHPMQDEAATAEADIAYLKTQKGSAVCETVALCYWAGKPETVDVFNLGQAYSAYAESPAPLVGAIARKTYAVMEFESLAPFQLTSPVLAATQRTYNLARSSDEGYFFVPNR